MRQCLLWLAAIIVAGSGVAHGQHGKAAAAEGINTNLNITPTDQASAPPARRTHYRLRNTALKRLEQELASTFGLSKRPSGSTALDQIHSLPTPVSPTRTRARDAEDTERERDWAFLNPDELSKAPTAEELLNIKNLSPEDRERNKLSAMERYFDNLNRPTAPGGTDFKPGQEDLFGSKSSSRPGEQSNRNTDTQLDDNPDEQRRELALRQMLGLDSTPVPSPANRPLESLLGFGKADAPPVSDLLRPSRRSFEELYNPRRSAATTPMSSLGIPATGGLNPYQTRTPDPRNAATAGSSGLSSYLNPAPTSRSTSMGALSSPVNPGFSPGTTLPDFNSQVLNAWNPAPPPQREEPTTRPRTTTPPSQFNAPQRNF